MGFGHGPDRDGERDRRDRCGETGPNRASNRLGPRARGARKRAGRWPAHDVLSSRSGVAYGEPAGQSLPTPGFASKQSIRAWMTGLIGELAVIQSARTWSMRFWVVARLKKFG